MTSQRLEDHRAKRLAQYQAAGRISHNLFLTRQYTDAELRIANLAERGVHRGDSVYQAFDQAMRYVAGMKHDQRDVILGTLDDIRKRIETRQTSKSDYETWSGYTAQQIARMFSGKNIDT